MMESGPRKNGRTCEQSNSTAPVSSEMLQNILELSPLLFSINFTHLSTDFTRIGITNTKRLMSPCIARGEGATPFVGEFTWSEPRTYIFRHYHVSLSDYWSTQHQWNFYAGRHQVWTTEGSKKFVEILHAELTDLKNNVPNNPARLKEHANLIMKIGECINLEYERQEQYEIMPKEQRELLEKPTDDIYTFGISIARSTQRITFKEEKIEHPFFPGDINLTKHLTGIFTAGDIDSTREWINTLLDRDDILVGSIDVLAAWEKVRLTLKSYANSSNHYCFCNDLLKKEEFRQGVIREIEELQTFQN